MSHQDRQPSDPLRIVVTGAGGRMGRSLVQAVTEMDGVVLSAALEREGSQHVGADSGALAGIAANDVPITTDALAALAACEAVIDFTGPAATIEFATLSAQARIVHVIGTTGLDEAQDARLDAASRHARIVQSGNYSAGVIVLADLVEKAAASLADFDCEIMEMHHKHKVDAPSGTALLMGEAAARGRHVDLAQVRADPRDGITGPREGGSVGFANLRGGSVVGTHTVLFAGEGETLELTHRATDRQIFARGAVRAAIWAFERKPGRYDMRDVLGLKDKDDE